MLISDELAGDWRDVLFKKMRSQVYEIEDDAPLAVKEVLPLTKFVKIWYFSASTYISTMKFT